MERNAATFPAPQLPSAPSTSRVPLSPRAESTLLRCTDSCGNSYSLWIAADERVGFEYRPQTPLFSSSGTYSGGAPTRSSGAVQREQYNCAVDAAVNGLLSAEARVEHREMGCSTISTIPQAVHGRLSRPFPLPFYVAHGHPVQAELERTLEECKKVSLAIM